MEKPLPAKARKVLVEASARIHLRDIKRAHALRDEMSSKWWEWLVGLLAFPAALGFFLTLIRLVESGDFFEGPQRVILRFLCVWAGLFVFSLMASYEIIARKLRAMRRYLREVEREFEEFRRERDQFRASLRAAGVETQEPPASAAADSSESGKA